MTIFCLYRSETEAIWIKGGNETRQIPSLKYKKLLKRRETLMSQFEKNEITRSFYLKQMGALCLKASKESDRLINEPCLTETPAADSDSNDSLSETRVMPHSSNEESSDQEDPFANRNSRSAPVRPRKRKARVPRPLCPVCGKGFQLNRMPPLHSNCCKCKKPTHIRCISKPMEVTFLCCHCEKKVSSRKSVSPARNMHQSDSYDDDMHTSTIHTTGPSVTAGEYYLLRKMFRGRVNYNF